MFLFHAKSFRRLPRSIQLKLNSREARGFIPITRALGDINDAMKVLDLRSGEIVPLLRNRQLCSFNIATNPAGTARYRVLTRSLEHFKEHGVRQPLNLRWDEIWQYIFEGNAPGYFLTGPQIERALNCSGQHVASLAQYFSVIKPARLGRGHVARFTTDSVENWLKSRKL